MTLIKRARRRDHAVALHANDADQSGYHGNGSHQTVAPKNISEHGLLCGRGHFMSFGRGNKGQVTCVSADVNAVKEVFFYMKSKNKNMK